MSHLFISEKFYSIQGEGASSGVPAIFIRLSGCNLLCQSENWVCDSIEVWRKGTKTPFEEVFTEKEVDLLRRGAHLVLTGGEPLMHQKKIMQFIDWFEMQLGFVPYTEIETNGTILPTSEFQTYIHQWNCSPKLENSGETFERRYNPIVLGVICVQENSWFKFVVDSVKDLREIYDFYIDSRMIKNEQVILMPAGATQEELSKNRVEVLELCKSSGFRYSDRLHIVAWNKKTGV